MDNYEVLYEKVMNKLPADVKNKINRKSIRDKMTNDSFLIPGDKKFPIKRPGSKEYDCKLIYAAYLRAKQWSKKKPQYTKVAAMAKTLFNKNKCSNKIHLNIKEDFIMNDIELKSSISLLEGEENSSNKEEVKELNKCICPKCGMMSPLDIDDAICEEKECPACKEKMTDSTFESEFISNKLQEQENIESKMKFLVDHEMGKNKGEPGNQFICSKCKTILDFYVKENEEGFCPKCGNTLRILEENELIINEEKRNTCPKCKTSTIYNIRESDCPVCQSNMVVFGKLKVKENKALPFSN
jgi:hypothetical protein